MGPQGLLALLESGVLKENQGSREKRAELEPRGPRATKDIWVRWAPLETLDPLAP